MARWRAVAFDLGFEIHRGHLPLKFLSLNRKQRHASAPLKDEEFTVEWRVGVPLLSISASKFQGQMTSVDFDAAYAFTEELKPGVVYNYRFNTNEIKKPIQEAVAACGWGYKGVAFGKL